MESRDQFSERERKVIEALLQGKSNKQIAVVLGLSLRTVEFHLSNVYKKLGVASRTEAVIELSERHLGNPQMKRTMNCGNPQLKKQGK